MSKYCTKCGTAIEADAKFCGKCGAEVKNYDAPQSTHSADESYRGKGASGRKLSPVKIAAIAICSVVIIVGLIWAVLPKGSTNLPAVNAGNNQSNGKNTTYSVSDFCDDVCGIWVLLEENNPYSSVTFLTITDDLQMTGGIYPGSYGRTCEISEIHQNEDGSIQSILHYPATAATEMDDAMPELRIIAIFNSDDMFRSSLIIEYEAGEIQEYEFVSANFEEATNKFDQMISGKSNQPSREAQNQQQTNDVEMCIWCGENPRSTSCSISSYCDSCRCAEPRCPYMHESRSLYCGSHNCNSSGCNERRCDGCSYCAAHKCIKNGCTREKDRNSEYCFAHK